MLWTIVKKMKSRNCPQSTERWYFLKTQTYPCCLLDFVRTQFYDQVVRFLTRSSSNFTEIINRYKSEKCEILDIVVEGPQEKRREVSPVLNSAINLALLNLPYVYFQFFSQINHPLYHSISSPNAIRILLYIYLEPLIVVRNIFRHNFSRTRYRFTNCSCDSLAYFYLLHPSGISVEGCEESCVAEIKLGIIWI